MIKFIITYSAYVLILLAAAWSLSNGNYGHALFNAGIAAVVWKFL